MDGGFFTHNAPHHRQEKAERLRRAMLFPVRVHVIVSWNMRSKYKC